MVSAAVVEAGDGGAVTWRTPAPSLPVPAVETGPAPASGGAGASPPGGELEDGLWAATVVEEEGDTAAFPAPVSPPAAIPPG
jgi:hypothetical protein